MEELQNDRSAMREVDEMATEAPEIPEDLERVLLFALREAVQTLAPGDVPRFEDLDEDVVEEYTVQLGVTREELPAALEEEFRRQAESRERMLEEGNLVPFTVLEIKRNFFIETHPGKNSEECYTAGRRTVEGARGATAYAFCYDGFVDTEDGERDALIAEGGVPGAEFGVAVGMLYARSEEGIHFESEPCYIGEAPNFMERLKDWMQYSDEDIDDRYLDPDAFNEEDAGCGCGCGCHCE